MSDKNRNREDTVPPAVGEGSEGGFKRLKRKNTLRQYRRRIGFVLFVAIVITVFVIGVAAVFFKVSEIKVRGNDIYPDADIIKSSGVVKDMNIYMINDDEVEGRLKQDYPYIRTVSIKRNIPSTVTLDLTCDTPDFYIEIEGQYFIISGDLRVLERFMSKKEVQQAYPEAIKITGGKVQSCIVGTELQFVMTSYSDTAKTLFSVLKGTEVYEGVSSIDFSDRFNIYVVYDSRLKANVGNMDDLELKLRFMNEIVKDLGGAHGTIDIKNVEAGYVLLNTTEEYE